MVPGSLQEVAWQKKDDLSWPCCQSGADLVGVCGVRVFVFLVLCFCYCMFFMSTVRVVCFVCLFVFFWFAACYCGWARRAKSALEHERNLSM